MNTVLTVKTLKLRMRRGYDKPITQSQETARYSMAYILKKINENIAEVSAYMKRGKRAEIVFKVTVKPLARP